MNKTIERFLELTGIERQAYLMDTRYSVTVKKYQKTNRRRASQKVSQEKRADELIHKNLNKLLNLIFVEPWSGTVTIRSRPERVPQQDQGGYLNYAIHGKTYGVHRLVWMFCNDRFIPKGSEIHHLDYNRSNNRIENLKLVETSRHRSSHAPK